MSFSGSLSDVTANKRLVEHCCCIGPFQMSQITGISDQIWVKSRETNLNILYWENIYYYVYIILTYNVDLLSKQASNILRRL